MKVKVPYSMDEVEIKSKEEAIKFICNMCNECPRSSMHTCSGVMALQCNCIKEHIRKEFSKVV